jgi:hypothetical protein
MTPLGVHDVAMTMVVSTSTSTSALTAFQQRPLEESLLKIST